MSDSRPQLAVIAVAILALLLPFLDKPFHVDDVYFLEVAGNVLKDPLRPFAGAVALEDVDYRVFAAQGRCPNTFESMSHPPLVAYVIALVGWVGGRFSEPELHLALLPFALAAGAAALHLARRFTSRPLEATLLIVVSPVFALAGQAVATDMAALALSLAALALLVAGVDGGRRWLVWTAGLLAGLACVTRYSALIMVPLLLLYGLCQGKPRRALPVLVGIMAVLGAWCAQNLIFHHELHVLASSRHYGLFYRGQGFDWTGLVKKALSDLAALGGTATAAAALLLAAGGRRRWLVFGGSALAAAGVFAARPRGIERLDTYSTGEVVLVCLAFGLGVVLVAEAIGPGLGAARPPSESAPEGRDRVFLAVWLWLALAGALLVLPFGTARYLLPVLPPLWLLLARRAELQWPGSARLRWAAAAAIAQGAALSVVLSLADGEYAERSRAVALEIRRDHPQRTIWYVGEWGFRYYMDSVGGRYLRSADDSPGVGDIIIRPFIAGMHEMSPEVRRRSVLLQDIRLQSRWPVRLMSFDAKAGYYSHHWGFLPWSFSHAPLERVEVFEVRVPAAPAGAATCASS